MSFKKQYLYFEQDKGLLVALQPATIYISVGKQLILTGFSLFVTEKNIPLQEKYRVFPERFAGGVARDLVTCTTKAALQHVVKSLFCQKTSSKLCKDVSASALRKFARTHSKWKTAIQIFFTGVYSGILSHVAIFIVGTAIAKTTESDAKFRESTKDNFSKMVGSIGLGAIGCAIGTGISPGRGTFVGGLIGDSILYVI